MTELGLEGAHGLLRAHRAELDLEEEPAQRRRIEALHQFVVQGERVLGRLHVRVHLVDLADLPARARAGRSRSSESASSR